jgi:iron(III) transport system ATP-binding protein
MPNTPMVKVTDLVKHFRRGDGTDVAAVDNVSLQVMPGTFTVLLGPSGCGKTTLLRCIAGLERPSQGRIDIRGRTVFSSDQKINLPPEKRGLNMIFQSYALWPHMTAAANVAYPLTCRQVPRSEIPARVQRALELVGIPELGKQYSNQLSGGQQQRVALARAIVSNSDLVLFDEPLSNVDAKVREQLRFELVAMQQQLNFAALYVTHDQVEAMELAHNIAVLEKGRIAQMGSPHEVYELPRSRYVAGFIGSINEIEGTIEAVDASGVATVKTPLVMLRVASMVDGLVPGDRVAVVCRPERAQLSLEEPAAENRWQATIRASMFSGSRTEHVLDVGSPTPFRVWRTDSQPLPHGRPAWIAVQPGDLRAIPWE